MDSSGKDVEVSVDALDQLHDEDIMLLLEELGKVESRLADEKNE